MEKKNFIPIRPQPADVAPTDIIDNGNDGLQRSPADPSPQPVSLTARLTTLFALLLASLYDRSKDGDFLTAVAAFIDAFVLRLGSDPLRPLMEMPTNNASVVPAWQEILAHQATIINERSGAFRRIDMARVNDNLTQVLLVQKVIKLFTSGLTQLNALERFFLNELAPTAIAFYKDNASLLTSHAVIQSNIEHLTTLAVGSGVASADQRRHNDQVRKKTEAELLAEHAAQPEPTPPSATPPIVTPPTPTTPAPKTARKKRA